MLTMFTNESLNHVIERSIMAEPWKIEIHAQIKKVFKLRDLPF